MKNKILKWGFRYLIIIIILGSIAIVIPDKMLEQELQTNETQEEVPLQNAVGEKVEEKKETKKQVNKITKKVNKKKTTKKVVNKQKKSTPRKVSTPKVSSNAYQNYAHNLVINKYGWSEYDFQCLVKLWNRESGWSATAHNNSSGAHGIPQAKPGNKMRSEGKDWKTNGYTQIRWGLKYIKERYGNPTKALRHSDKYHWY